MRLAETLLRSLFILLCLVPSACSLFSTREPEAPEAEGGTFFQPDTPEQVVENIESSIRN